MNVSEYLYALSSLFYYYYYFFLMPSFFVYFSVVLPALGPHMLQVWSGAYLRVEIEGFENSFSYARSSFCIIAFSRGR